MNTSTTHHPTDRNPLPKVITLLAAVAAAVMLLAAVAAEAASRGVSLQFGAPEPPACRSAGDTTLPPQLQIELRAQCGE